MGFSQGSVLGPNLFLIFLNDLLYNIQHCKYFLYADDILMFKKLTKENILQDIDLFRPHIHSIEKWCLKMNLQLIFRRPKYNFFHRIVSLTA